jgi:hypothetical protein
MLPNPLDHFRAGFPPCTWLYCWLYIKVDWLLHTSCIRTFIIVKFSFTVLNAFDLEFYLVWYYFSIKIPAFFLLNVSYTFCLSLYFLLSLWYVRDHVGNRHWPNNSSFPCRYIVGLYFCSFDVRYIHVTCSGQ